MHVRVLEFYSGIGGLHRALKLSNIDATVVRAFDWDQTSCLVYDAVYGPGTVRKIDISTIGALDILGLDASCWLLSPSCQPYTVLNPVAKGAADPRARSFLHVVQDLLPELVKVGRGPKWMLVENVAGFETSTARQTLIDVLELNNYAVVELLLTPLQFGIPNSRLRYYLLAKARPLSFAHVVADTRKPRRVWRHIPGHGTPWNDSRINCGAAQLRIYLDHLPDEENHQCNIPDRVLEKWGRLFDIVMPSSRRSCCFTRGYTRMVERSGSILQMNEELDRQTTRVFDEFLSLQVQSSASSDKLRSDTFQPTNLLLPLRLRYFSPSELLRLFHFEPLQSPNGSNIKFIWPQGVSEKSKYRLIGNSVNVEVVRHLINYLFEGDDEEGYV
ncbi:hypothetical protein M0805_006591 [Coniferiporia weirii]|nr:hypothetical protein M0805_006591 [Coniferiporia weirii]